jgi:hypothetical protein
MSIFVELADDAVDFLKEAGHELKEFIVTEAQKAVIFLKQNEPLVTKALNLISLAASKSVSGADKMNGVIAAITDIAHTFIAEGGFSGLLAKGVDLVREFAQSVFNDFKAQVGGA